jgi:hypothetical protein
METISISSQREISMTELRQTLAKHWRVEDATEGRLVVEEGNSRVYFAKSETPPGLSIDYSDIELVKQVLKVIADRPDFIVDNDFGTVLPGDQFVGRIRFDKHWNWRDDRRK